MSADTLTKKNEAVERMQLLRLDKNIIHNFQQNDLVWLSNFPECFEVTKDHDFVNHVIQKLKNQYDTLVYHIIFSSTDFGNLLSFLTVSPYPEEWEFEKEDIRSGIVFSWVENISNPVFSEFGSISIESNHGILTRTY